MLKNKWGYFEEAEEGKDGGGGDPPPGDPAPPAAEGSEGNPPASEPPVAEPPADWTPDWREKIAKGDEKMLKRLSRFASPAALAESYVQVSSKLSQSRPLLGKDATEEQIKEFREYLGIPEKPDGYDLTGLTIDGNDKRLIESYLARAHGTHQTNEQVRAGINAYQEIAQALTTERHDLDSQIANEANDVLHNEWGGEYRRNINLINSLMDSAPEGLKENFFKGRLMDGTPIGSSAPLLRWLLSMELERNPARVVTPGSGEIGRAHV